MKKNKRDIILLVKEGSSDVMSFNKEFQKIHHIVGEIENMDVFCNAHELASRNRITQKKYKIRNAIKHPVLKPFRFLINKN